MSRTENQRREGAFVEDSPDQKPGSHGIADGSTGTASEPDLSRGLFSTNESPARHSEGDDRCCSQTGPHRLPLDQHSPGIRYDRLPRAGAPCSGPETNETPSPGP